MMPFVLFSGIAPTVGDTAIGQSILQLLTRRIDLPIHVHSSRRDVFGALPEATGQELRRKLPVVPAPPLRSAALPLRLWRLVSDLRRTGGAHELPRPTYEALRETLHGCAAVVMQGGPAWTDRMLTGRRVVEQWLFMEAARHYGARVYHAGVSCGPFAWDLPKGAWMRPLCRQALDCCDMLLVRDRLSRPALHRLGVRSAVVESTDAAVFLEPQADPRYAAIESLVTASRRRRVVVAVRDFQPFYPEAVNVGDEALRALAMVLDHVQREWADVVFLSTDHTPQPLKRTDPEVAAHVQSMMTVPGATVVDVEVANPAALKRIYGRFDAMITMRLHPAILALGAGVPSLVLAYDPKCDDFLSRLGLEEYLMPLQAFRARPAIDRLGAMLHTGGLRTLIQVRYAALRASHASDYDPMIAAIQAGGRVASA